MNWPPAIEDLRVRIGLQSDDTSRDADLTLASEVSLDVVETYLDRKLTFAEYTEWADCAYPSYLVMAWPIDRTAAVTVNGTLHTDPSFSGHIDWEKGIIHHANSHPYQITYSGGFNVLPPVLLWAMLSVFDSVWASDSAFGGAVGSSIIQGSGAIKKVSLVGIGSVDLDVGTTVSDGGGANSGAAWGLIPSAARTILDRYRRESAVGVG
jgi:hypothetical protein